MNQTSTICINSTDTDGGRLIHRSSTSGLLRCNNLCSLFHRWTKAGVIWLATKSNGTFEAASGCVQTTGFDWRTRATACESFSRTVASLASYLLGLRAFTGNNTTSHDVSNATTYHVASVSNDSFATWAEPGSTSGDHPSPRRVSVQVTFYKAATNPLAITRMGIVFWTQHWYCLASFSAGQNYLDSYSVGTSECIGLRTLLISTHWLSVQPRTILTEIN